MARRKGQRTVSRTDGDSQFACIIQLVDRSIPLFNPRALAWREHFAWTTDGLRIIGLIAVGRATIGVVRLNDPWLIWARRIWTLAGVHPYLG